MSYDKPLPVKNPDTAFFWDGCREHELRFEKCGQCSHVRWPPAMLCPRCHSRQTDRIISGGRGSVFSYVIYRETPHPAFQGDLPYVVALVELEEGPRLLTNIVGCPPEEVRCDMPVVVAWEDVTQEVSLPKFRPSPCATGQR